MLTGPVSCSLLWTKGCLLLSLKRSDSVVCPAVPPLYLEVKGGAGIDPWMPVCFSHVSDKRYEGKDFSISDSRIFNSSHAQDRLAVKCKMIRNTKQHKKTVKGQCKYKQQERDREKPGKRDGLFYV